MRESSHDPVRELMWVLLGRGRQDSRRGLRLDLEGPVSHIKELGFYLEDKGKSLRRVKHRIGLPRFMFWKDTPPFLHPVSLSPTEPMSCP